MRHEPFTGIAGTGIRSAPVLVSTVCAACSGTAT